MWKNIEGKEVVIIVTSRGTAPLRYAGTVKSVDDQNIELQNASIKALMSRATAGIFGDNSSLSDFGQNIPTVIVNKSYIVSVSAN